ncbi:MAG: TM2 domain-containing protein [Deltaproteobacteria bacterium]|nr:TM2 domain-containing protein [Deltaproteobacteria bacterium]
MANERDSGTAYLLWALAFIGFCGFHRFYLDRPVSGVIWLCTFGLCGVGQLIDLFLIPEMLRQSNRELAARWQPQALPPGSILVLPPGSQARGPQPEQQEAAVRAGARGAAPAQGVEAGPAGPPLSPEERLQVELTRLAQQRGGSITVAEGVAATGRPPREVQQALDVMARDGFVDMDIHTETGAIFYAFRSSPRNR